ncbi:hypothetical protein EDD16DRAFT_1522331 [Pisolithus croceorrhizus]|nr:hypothetical protein EDD16DRAFT_1522331 [Pisolithus croceorrhizus]KAI6156345.1 hypothetical protein EDD17DRAFT_1512525 [Pisolithus thermaeus]
MPGYSPHNQNVANIAMFLLLTFICSSSSITTFFFLPLTYYYVTMLSKANVEGKVIIWQRINMLLNLLVTLPNYAYLTMAHNQAFNITPKMIHLQVFCWFKQFVDSSIFMDTALDNIEFALGPDYNSDEWMDLAYCVMMEPGHWSDVEKVWMQQLGIGGPSSDLHSQPSGVLTVLGIQESSPGNQESSSGTYHHLILMLFSEYSPQKD